MPSGRPPRYERANPAKFVGIPPELRALNRWVCWRVHPRDDGKPAKIPVSPLTGEDASVTNSNTWGTFEQAYQCFEEDTLSKRLRLAGLGFVFVASDGLAGVDIDDCRVAETGVIKDWGLAIIEALASYTEISPSGTGVKIFIRGSVPGSEARRNKIEMYSTARYFTVTGDVHPVILGDIDYSTAIQPRQQKLDELYRLIFGEVGKPRPQRPVVEHSKIEDSRKLARVRAMPDDELVELATSAANGKKFSRLWDGETSDYHDDHSRADMALCSILAYWTRADATRVDKLFRLSKLYRPKWDERRGAQTYGARTVLEACAVSQSLYDPDVEAGPTRNDLGNADIFIRLCGEDFRFISQWKMWLWWNGTCWQRDAEGELRQSAERIPQELMKQAKTLMQAGVEDGPKAYRWALQSGEAHRLASVDSVLRWRLQLADSELDKQPFKLATGSGVLDLTNASSTEGKRGDWLTRGTSVHYNARATCPRFDAFLAEIMLGDTEMIDYLWRVLGYCLTGDTSERAFFILHGIGRNGKTTFVEVLHALLDNYAQTAKFTTFLTKSVTGGANDDIAHLAGARVVIASEAEESQKLDAAVVKTLTGSDTVRARFLYSNEFEFRPAFKLFLVTNHIPKINDGSQALWDRLHYIPFEYRVAEDHTDKLLGLKLLGELEGILAKAVEGCLEWQRGGLRPPAKVIKAVEELRDDMDPVGEALKTLVEPSVNGKLVHARLYEAYVSWCRANGIRYPVSSKALARAIKGLGHELKPGNANVRIWPNLRLRPNGDELHEI